MGVKLCRDAWPFRAGEVTFAASTLAAKVDKEGSPTPAPAGAREGAEAAATVSPETPSAELIARSGGEDPAAAAEAAAAVADSLAAAVAVALLPPSTESHLILELPAGLVAPALKQPDFSGSWLCIRVVGDWDRFLRDDGVAWALRRVAQGAGFGVGIQVQAIIQSGDELAVVNAVHGFPGKEEQVLHRADGKLRTVIDLHGRKIESVTWWEGDVLATKERLKQGGHVLHTVRRFMAGEEMCTERTSPSGLVVQRYYRRL